MRDRLKIAIQKSGRLAERSTALLMKCGLDFDLRKDRLFHQCNNFPVDLMLVRDDDIPAYVADGVCHLGIVGENSFEEKYNSAPTKNPDAIRVLMKLGFGTCRLALAVPEDKKISRVQDFNGLRIATSYPSCLKRFLVQNEINAEIVELTGSVEIAPRLKIAEAICDLVSSGGTLKSNGLREVTTLFESQAVLLQTGRPLSSVQQEDLERLMQRAKGVIQASQSKYIMMHAPREALTKIRRIIPGMEEPSILSLATDSDRIAIHAVAREGMFWETIEGLKSVGATSILVMPIEKVVS